MVGLPWDFKNLPHGTENAEKNLWMTACEVNASWPSEGFASPRSSFACGAATVLIFMGDSKKGMAF